MKRKVKIGFLLTVFVFLFLCIWGILIITRPPFWAKVWNLDDGTIVEFYRTEHNPPGRDDIKNFELVWPDGKKQTFQFGQTHAGYQKVELRSNQKENIIWLVDTFDSRIGCSINLKTGGFIGEIGVHPEVVGIDKGKLIK